MVNLISSELISDQQKTFYEKQTQLISDVNTDNYMKDSLIASTYFNSIDDFKVLTGLINQSRNNELC